MEIFDIVNEYGEPVGETVSRELAHSQGYRHRTSHVWLVRKTETGYEVFLQKRSDDKDSYPGCYDISSAGHIPAGCSFTESAIRELSEELGIEASEQELILCGQCYDRRENLFHGQPFIDDQVSNIYLLMWREGMEITLQEEEVSGYIWLEINEAMTKIGDGAIKHCIRLNELEMIRTKLCEKERTKAREQYPPTECCSICKGHCCKTLGCSLSPADLLRMTGRSTLEEDMLVDILKEQHLAIDRMSGRDGYLYYLRMQHKCFTFIGVDAYGECYALGENGCVLSDDERPEGGRRLQPVEPGRCVQTYGAEEMYKDWRPYRRLLDTIWKKYEKLFEEDGTFDACEESYMKWQMGKRK